eukprot:2171699-Prymnesium_polylepis.1
MRALRCGPARSRGSRCRGRCPPIGPPGPCPSIPPSRRRRRQADPAPMIEEHRKAPTRTLPNLRAALRLGGVARGDCTRTRGDRCAEMEICGCPENCSSPRWPEVCARGLVGGGNRGLHTQHCT